MKQISINNFIFFNFPKNKIQFLYFFIIILTLIFGAPVAFGDTVHFDSNGNIVDKIQTDNLNGFILSTGRKQSLTTRTNFNLIDMRADFDIVRKIAEFIIDHHLAFIG